MNEDSDVLKNDRQHQRCNKYASKSCQQSKLLLCLKAVFERAKYYCRAGTGIFFASGFDFFP